MEEHDSLTKNDMWTLVDATKDEEILVLTTKWIFKNKNKRSRKINQIQS